MCYSYVGLPERGWYELRRWERALVVLTTWAPTLAPDLYSFGAYLRIRCHALQSGHQQDLEMRAKGEKGEEPYGGIYAGESPPSEVQSQASNMVKEEEEKKVKYDV